jgi:hypothetical protein
MTSYDRRQIEVKLDEARATAAAFRDAVTALRSFAAGLEWHTNEFPAIGWDAKIIDETLDDWAKFNMERYLNNVEQALRDNVL